MTQGKFTAPPKNMKLKEVMPMFKLGSADSLTTMPCCLIQGGEQLNRDRQGQCRINACFALINEA